MSENVIETQDLTVYYGKHRGIEDVNLSVEKGEVFGFLGPNGAGKTTTQRVLLDVIRPTSGRATIFGLDCREKGVEIRQRVGYLPGELALYTNMKADKFFEMYEYLRPDGGTKGYWRELSQKLNLDTDRKIREFSRGNKQKVGIVAAFMSRPNLLILDEPTGGLDPLVQQTVLEMVEEAKADGRTIFFSSHILSEVQTVCDRVGIIRDGRLIETQRVEELITRRIKRMTLIFPKLPPADAFNLEGVTEVERSDQKLTLEVKENLPQVLTTAAQYEVEDIETHSISLEEIFLAYYGKENGGNHG
ncbi:MAG: ABC transporter ATP-binding protein [Candidatus Promineifilaceae bacterium]